VAPRTHRLFPVADSVPDIIILENAIVRKEDTSENSQLNLARTSKTYSLMHLNLNSQSFYRAFSLLK